MVITPRGAVNSGSPPRFVYERMAKLGKRRGIKTPRPEKFIRRNRNGVLPTYGNKVFGIGIDLDIRGIHEVKRWANNAARKAVVRGAERILADAIALAPEGEDQGPRPPDYVTLKDSLQIWYSDNYMQATVGSESPVALWIEFGTRAHGPVEAEVLRFEIQGEIIYAQQVRGITPYPFLYMAYLMSRDAIIEIFEEELGKLNEIRFARVRRGRRG